MLGINLGSQNTKFSICGLNEKEKFTTQTLQTDTSERTLPSIISFTPKDRKVGVIAENDIKKYPKKSFINVPRYIGLPSDSDFFEKEKKYGYISPDFNENENKFELEFGGKSYLLLGDDVVAAFLDKVIEAYSKNNKDINYDEVSISIPDYFNPIQRDSINLILKSNGIKTPHIINESTAITLYYGYSNYINLFKNQTASNIKNVIFVDIGHSKTTFFLSQFKFNEFKVLYVKSIPFLGGRNFDESICDLAKNKFLLQFGEPFPESEKTKRRLMESILKARKQLTVNDDANITLESIINDEDFTFTLTKETFEQIISNHLESFTKNFLDFIKEYKEATEIEEIHSVEMAGELLRTPILQKIIIKILKLKDISKTILVDECTSVGAALFNAYALKKFPLKSFEFLTGYNMYDIYYTVDNDNNHFETFINSGSQLPFSNYIDISIDNHNLSICLIDFFFNQDNLPDFSKSQHLIQYSFDLKSIKKNNSKNFSKSTILYLHFGIRHSGFIKFLKITNGKEDLAFNENNVKKSKSGIYKNDDDEEDAIVGLTSILTEHDEFDKLYSEMENQKIEVSKSYYKIKNEMKKIKELNENTERGRKLLERMNNIRKKINDLNHDFIRRESGLKRINSIRKHINEVKNDYDFEFDLV